MSTLASNNLFHMHESADSKPSSPVSPSHSLHSQQSVPRSFTTTIRGQITPFSSTPTASISQSAALDPLPGQSWGDFIRTWSDAHVARWLADSKCGHHASIFKANDIRGDILLELDQPTLQEMGMTSVGDRFRILGAVRQLRQKAATKVVAVQRAPEEAPASDKTDTSSTSRRRLETARPAPLTLSGSSNRNDLPRLVREQQPPDSAKAIASSSQPLARPLPQPVQGSTASSSANTVATSGYSSSNVPRSQLPPLPPPPRGQPPLPPPGRPPVRNFPNSAPGRRTPTQSDNVPAYVTQALPPAPNQSLLTPSSATSNWTGYHLPADPRPGNPGGGKTPQGNSRATSPLPRATRSNANGQGHGRTASAALASPVTSSPSSKRSGSHPYATGQSVVAAPHKVQIDLSPIAEGFLGANSSSAPSPYSVGRGPFNPGTPSHSNAPSLDDLRKKLVKIALPDEGLTYTIDVNNCAGGVEILEKVLKKFGKGTVRSLDSDTDDVQTEDGGLSVDGWGAYLDDGTGPLAEAALLSYCHASLDHPARDKPLALRKIARARRNKSPSGGRSITNQTTKATRRASAVSILSGLGVRDPERALEQPPSPTQSMTSGNDSGRSSPANTSGKRPSKLRNFFGQRPPSELITNHLTEYFPYTEKKVLERTARHSMMRTNTMSYTKRDSTASWNPPSRFSSSTVGSGTRTSISRASVSSTATAPPALPEKAPSPHSDHRASEDIPRVSLSTDDGRSIDLHDHPSDVPDIHPQLLPPIPFPTESFSESLESITGDNRRVSRALSTTSRASRRLSYMTELRSKRDRSDTASLMTVDEITAEVENRRRNTIIERQASDTEEWTEVDSSEGQDGHLDKGPEDALELADEFSDEEDGDGQRYDDGNVSDEDEDTTLNEDDDVGEETGEVVIRKANKWIKGALIGAGSFGKVYLGMDASSGLLMAVKQVELPTGSAPNEERKQSMLSALEHEIELLQDLQHDNIVQYLYSSLEDDCLNIFLEYVPGGSVTALLRNYGAFEEPLVKNFVRQILQGLTYLHERDIIHRDIKGANILVDNKGGVKISDFGISKKVDVGLLTGNRAHRPSLQGSVFWMAPEVVKQSGHTQKADIWSVGCLVVEMFTGEHPWAQLTQMQAIFKIGSSAKPSIPSDISGEAQDFLTRTFDLDHGARPSAVELLQHPWIASGKKP